MADLANLVSRLEAVTLRLEKCGAGGAGGASAADDDDDYGNYIYVINYQYSQSKLKLFFLTC